MGDLLHSVYDIFTSYLTEHNNDYYNIPEYQRGYKWDTDNVNVLLDDFYKFHDNFIKSENENQFYCLQNITLCKTELGYNVVDGQQRLTTLLVLLAYLDKPDLVQDKIKYSIRENTHQFIQNQIVSRKIWDHDINPQSANTKDQYYLCDVAKSIQYWFDNNKDVQKDKFVETILKHVKLIVNRLDGNEEKIFSNLNSGKVNLDGADLIRAILMTRAAKEKFEQSTLNEQINEFRVRMGIEIDAINLWWGDKDVNDYFKQFLPDKTIKQAESQFSHTDFPINLLHMLYFESKKQKEETFSFRFFEYGQDSNGKSNDNHWEMFDDITNLHNLLQDWYNDREIYHYLGFLFFRFKVKIKFRDIYEDWLKCESKTQFKLQQKNKIIEFILNEYEDKEQANQTREAFLKELEKEIVNINKNWYENDDQLFNILILQDILHCINSSNIDRLSVNYFTRNTEDKEHIRSQTPQWKDKTRNKKIWESFIDEFEAEEIRKKIERILA